jgi:hypothetical protein
MIMDLALSLSRHTVVAGDGETQSAAVALTGRSQQTVRRRAIASWFVTPGFVLGFSVLWRCGWHRKAGLPDFHI